MYQNLTIQNPLLNQFNGYMAQNPNTIPFQNNQLITNNVHVGNHLNDFMQEHKMVQQNMPMYQQQYFGQVGQPMNAINQQLNNIPQKTQKNNGQGKVKNFNIIEDMLKPVKIKKDANTNKDVDSNYCIRKNIQKNAKKGKINIKMTNAPYKSIIKDKIITKKVEDIKEADLVVHKVIEGVDNDIKQFEKELKNKKDEKEKINDELKIEFHIDNWDAHKKNFEYKESFIRNLAFEENTFDENKQDYIDFYKQKQKEAEEGIKLVDQVLENFTEGIIGEDELPTEITNGDGAELDLKSIIGEIQTDDIYNLPDAKENKTTIPKKNIKNISNNNKTTTTTKKILQTSSKTTPNQSLVTNKKISSIVNKNTENKIVTRPKTSIKQIIPVSQNNKLVISKTSAVKHTIPENNNLVVSKKTATKQQTTENKTITTPKTSIVKQPTATENKTIIIPKTPISATNITKIKTSVNIPKPTTSLPTTRIKYVNTKDIVDV